eukprot:759313-Hanusia_phi.AAC.1
MGLTQMRVDTVIDGMIEMMIWRTIHSEDASSSPSSSSSSPPYSSSYNSVVSCTRLLEMSTEILSHSFGKKYPCKQIDLGRSVHLDSVLKSQQKLQLPKIVVDECLLSFSKEVERIRVTRAVLVCVSLTC